MKIVPWSGVGMGSFGCVRCVVSIRILGEWKGGENRKKGLLLDIRISVYLNVIGFFQVFLSAD